VPQASDDGYTDSRLLARALSGPADDEPWSNADLAAMLRHQWSAPLCPDLERVAPGAASRAQPLAAAAAPPIHTFGDLLFHPQPPLELLVLLKEFGKAAPDAQEHPLPHELGAFFYHAAIALARQRHGRAISSISEDRLNEALRWATVQPWLGEGARALLALLLP
jgi:hypothetical protein